MAPSLSSPLTTLSSLSFSALSFTSQPFLQDEMKLFPSISTLYCQRVSAHPFFFLLSSSSSSPPAVGVNMNVYLSRPGSQRLETESIFLYPLPAEV